MAELGASLVISLAKSGYEACLCVKSNQEDVARIAERLTWIIRRRNKWENLLNDGPETCHDTMERLRGILVATNLVIEAASKPQKNWRAKIRAYMGAKSLASSIERVEKQLNRVLQDIHMDQASRIADFMSGEERSIKEVLERFGQATSSNDVSKTNQQEIDEALHATLQETSELMFGQCDDDLLDAETLDWYNGGGSSTLLEEEGSERVTFSPSKKELLSLQIDPDALQCKYKNKKRHLLGEGAFSHVYRGTYNNIPVAIKCFKIDSRELNALSRKQVRRDAKRIAREALLAHRCSMHPNIVQILGFHVGYHDDCMERPLIVMEQMHATLYDVLHYQKEEHFLSFSRRLDILHDIVRALEFLHLQGIVHHDVKTLNILLNEDFTEAKLADFGEAKVKGLNTTRLQLSSILSTAGPQKGGAAGTVAYQAPEILSEEVRESSRISEMYSFGVTVWECMTDCVPHRGKKENSITILALKKDIPMLSIPESPRREVTSVSDQVACHKMKTIAKDCLSRDRSARPTASQVVRQWNRLAVISPSPTPTSTSLQQIAPSTRSILIDVAYRVVVVIGVLYSQYEKE